MVVRIPYLDQIMGKFVCPSFKKIYAAARWYFFLFVPQETEKKLMAEKLSIKSSMLLMVLPVTSSAEFKTFSVVFIAKFC